MSGYSVTNYNPYNVNNNFAFKGATDTTSQIKNVPQLTQQPDTVTFNTKNKKESLSNGAKWGLGALALAGVATLAYVLSKGKVGAKQTQQIVEQVEFKPAKTIEEAKKFAKDKFDVTYNKIEDLEAVNFFNEWLAGVHNKCSIIDKSSYPKFISNTNTLEDNALFCLCDDTLKYGNKEGYVMGVNMSIIKNFDKSMDKWICDSGVITKNKEGKFVIISDAYNTEFVRGLTKRMNEYNSNTTTFKEKNRIILDIMGIQDGKIINGKIQQVHYNDFHCLNHELGHLRHQECANNYKQMKKIEEFQKQGEQISDITKEFVTNAQIQETARKVSDYAPESPLEFVAEVFAQLMEGKKFPDDVMALYKKYGGPAVS